jgi:hypothetical protein
VTLSEIKKNIEGMVLLDGIPATFFLSLTDYDNLRMFGRRLLELFQPSLIAGISDMLPPDGDIERVRTIGEDVANFEI